MSRAAVVASVRRVSALTIRRQLRRYRRHLAVIGVVVALVGLIAAHHSAVFTDMHHDAGMHAVVELCLGVFTAVGAALVAVAVAIVVLKRPRALPAGLTTGSVVVPGVPVARARHGPAVVCVLCVSRR